MNLRAIVLLAHTLIWTGIGIFVMVIDPTGRLYMWLARVGWARQLLILGGLPVALKGIENIDPKQSYVVCANHQSLIDIPVLVGTLPIPIRFVAKKSLFFIPIFGWSLFLAGFIPIVRGAGKQAHESLKKAAKRIKNGRSITVFPEGTRSPDGRIHEFKAGAFVMAIEAGVPILPVVIKGTFKAGPKNKIHVTPSLIELIVGTPISSQGLELKDRSALSAKTREVMVAMFEGAR